MPELPDITLYEEALNRDVVGQVLERLRVLGPSLVKTFEPPISAVEGRRLRSIRRIGKRLALGFDDDLWVVLHLMIAGRLRWQKKDAKLSSKTGQALFQFESGALHFTEASSHKRASLHVVRGKEALTAFDQGGLEVLQCSEADFVERLEAHRHTLKRAMTDPRILSGIGNAYSDEILHKARLSPMRRTDQLRDDEWSRLFVATREVLQAFTELLRHKSKGRFPDKVTAFVEEMAVHGRYGKPCPDCGAAVQRIRYADNECNYCAVCQTEGRLLADRALSALLKKDWPKTLAELEELKESKRQLLGDGE